MEEHAREIPDFNRLQKRFEIERKIKEITVVEGELTSLGNTANVYKQQPNSCIFFKSDKGKCLQECKADIKSLEQDLQKLEKNSLS